MILLKGRPKDESGREAREIRVYDYLDALGIEFYRVDHARAETMYGSIAREKESFFWEIKFLISA